MKFDYIQKRYITSKSIKIHLRIQIHTFLNKIKHQRITLHNPIIITSRLFPKASARQTNPHSLESATEAKPAKSKNPLFFHGDDSHSYIIRFIDKNRPMFLFHTKKNRRSDQSAAHLLFSARTFLRTMIISPLFL